MGSVTSAYFFDSTRNTGQHLYESLAALLQEAEHCQGAFRSLGFFVFAGLHKRHHR